MAKIILAIETSCDETVIALVKCSGTAEAAKFEVIKNAVSSQIDIHRPFGGVVPNLAKREHIKNLPVVLNEVLNPPESIPEIDYIAVTVGPGLEPALWTGITFAQELAKKINKPLIGVNHMEGHLYSNWLPKENQKTIKIPFPSIGLVVSGGHTILLAMKNSLHWTKLGETIDDAAGEAFDKVAKMLELPYPGGPEIMKLAALGNPKAVAFPRPMLNRKNYDFSFSGLKTSVLYYKRDNPKTKKEDVAASFQQAVIDTLVKKTLRAAEEFNAASVTLSGGVAANKTLRDALKEKVEGAGMQFFVPDFKFNTDNAAMAAAAAYFSILKKEESALPLEANANLNL